MFTYFEDFQSYLRSQTQEFLFASLPANIRRRINISSLDSLDSCWLWTGMVLGRVKKKKISYPALYLPGQKLRPAAHHIINILGFDKQKGKLKLLCEHTLCVNPLHVYYARYSKFCKNGHLRVSSNFTVRRNGSKVCLACNALRMKKKYQKNKEKENEFRGLQPESSQLSILS